MKRPTTHVDELGRVCIKCGKYKIWESFYISQAKCKECSKVAYREYAKREGEALLEKKRQYARKKRQEDPVLYRQKGREYYYKNWERCRYLQRLSFQRNYVRKPVVPDPNRRLIRSVSWYLMKQYGVKDPVLVTLWKELRGIKRAIKGAKNGKATEGR